MPTANVILERDGQILLTKRARAPKAGYWDLPGGFVENESLEDAALRELREELGITVSRVDYVGSYADSYVFEGKEQLVLTTIFSANLPKQAQITVRDDVSGYEFFSTDLIPWEKIGFKSVVSALEDYGVSNEKV